MNNQNNSGNNSTTNQNAYNNQKQIQENIGNFRRDNLRGGMSNNTNINIGNNFNATGHPVLGYNGKNETEEANESENQNLGNSSNQKNDPLPMITENLKTETKNAIKKKIFIKLLPIIGVVLGILLFVLLVASAFSMINVYMGEILNGDNISNFLIGDGFRSTSSIVNDRIKKAKDDAKNKGVDDYDIGILYATVNTGVIMDLDFYDSNDEDTREDNYNNDPDNYQIKTGEAWSFYQVRKDMLGTVNTPGTMAYNLIGQKIQVECSESQFSSKLSFIDAFAEYIANGIMTGTGVVLGDTTFTFPVTFDTSKRTNNNALTLLIDEIKTMIAFNGEQLNYVEYKSDKLKREFQDTNFINKVTEDIKQFVNQYNATQCGPNQYKRAKAVMQNDYNQYFGYISNIFVPTIYNFSSGKYTESEQKKIIEETISDIANARNDYYFNMGETNYLTYAYRDGNYASFVSNNPNAMIYMSDVPISADAQVALTWKQGGSKWSSYLLGTTSDTNMGRIGCLVTSLAKLMKVSGTKIYADYFDPGVLAETIKNNGGFSSGGGLNSYYKWQTLVPNFNYVSQNSGIYISATSSNVSGQVASYIGNNTGNGYYYIIHIKYLAKDGTTHNHYISVVGSDNGEYMLSDPAFGTTYSIEKLSSYYRNARIVNVIIFKASDV